jgi:hypothetical protein
VNDGSTPRKKFRWLRYLGIPLLAVMIWIAGPADLWAVARETRPGWIALAFLLNLPALGLKAFRWWLMVRWQGMRLSFGRAYLAYYSALLVGFLTPGRVGEMVKAFTLKRECGVTFGRGFSSVLADRLFDLYLLLMLGAVGFVRFSFVDDIGGWGGFALACAALLVPLFFLRESSARWLGRRLAALPLLRRKRELILGKVDDFAGGLTALTPPRIALCALLTVAAYVLFFVQCMMCAWALGFTLDWVDLVLMMAATNLIGFISPFISNIGTREIALTSFLALVTPPFPMETAVAWGMVQFLVFFFGGGLIGFICWQISPMGLRKAVEDVRQGEIQNSKSPL